MNSGLKHLFNFDCRNYPAAKAITPLKANRLRSSMLRRICKNPLPLNCVIFIHCSGLVRSESRRPVLVGEDQRLKKPGVLTVMTGGVGQSTSCKALLFETF